MVSQMNAYTNVWTKLKASKSLFNNSSSSNNKIIIHLEKILTRVDFRRGKKENLNRNAFHPSLLLFRCWILSAFFGVVLYFGLMIPSTPLLLSLAVSTMKAIVFSVSLFQFGMGMGKEMQAFVSLTVSLFRSLSLSSQW